MVESRRKVYTFGYGRDRMPEELCKMVPGPVIVLDVRRSRGSRNGAWEASEYGPYVLEERIARCGGLYRGDARLGNTGRSAKWKPGDEQKARESVAFWAGAAKYGERSIILVCAERDHRRCHRTEVAEQIARLADAEVVHLP